MLSALYAIAHPSVRPSVTQMDQSKTVEVRIMEFSPYGHGRPIPLVLWAKFHPEILTGSPERGNQTRKSGETSHFLDLNVNNSKTVGDTSKVTIRPND